MAAKKAAKEQAKAAGAISAEQQEAEAKRKAAAKQKAEDRKYSDKSRVHKK